MKRACLSLFLILLTGFCRAGEASLEERIDVLLAEKLAADATRENVVQQLVALGAEAYPILARRLESKDLLKFLAIREALIELGPAASPALRSYVDTPPGHRARAAMSILSKIGHPGDLEFFLEHADHPAWQLRGGALRGIGNTGVVSATVEQAIRPRLDDPDPSVRRYAVRALGKTGTPTCFPRLAESLDDSSFFVRRAASRALGELWQRSATSEIDLIPLLKRTENTAQWPTQIIAIETLGRCRSPLSEERLRQLAEDPDPTLRQAATRAINQKRD